MQRLSPALAVSFAGLSLVACGSAAAPANKPAATGIPTARPTPTARPVPGGPFAVIVTNSDRQGVSYQVELIDGAGTVAAKATAKLPLLKPNQTVSPPLVSASDSRVYYRDGDTDIRTLDPSGNTSLAKTVAAGTSSILAFSVNPGDSQVAVALISQAGDQAKSTSMGYVEDLDSTGHHVDLWNNTGPAALRWPVGWFNNTVVDAIGGCGGYGYGNDGSGACSYHVVDPTSGARTATVCEGPATPPAGTSVYYSPSGLPSRAGVACNENEQPLNSCGGTYTISRADWTGHEQDFTSKNAGASCNGNPLSVNDCYVSQDGTIMACSETGTGAADLLLSNGVTQNLGRKYTTLGWIDGRHILYEVDPSTLGVVVSPSGELTSIPFEHADHVAMVTTLPGGF